MSRGVIFQALKNDAELQALWPQGITVYGSNATDSPDRTKPFIIITSRGRTKAFSGTGAEEIVVWVHRPTGLGKDYGLIDLVLHRAKEILLGLDDEIGSDGWALTAVSWLGTSEDLFDDGYNTIAKNSSFRVASRYVSFVAPG